MITPKDIEHIVRAGYRYGAAIAAKKVTDTVKIANKNRFIESTPDRSMVWLAQTPQVFKASEILSAYKFVKKNKLKITDDVAAYTAYGKKVSIVENLNPNPKITVPQDIAYIEFLETRKA